jgi:septal ring factor EnvC (AmiA/AmiB activator)
LSDLRDKTAELGFGDSGILDLLLRPSFFEKKGHLPSPIKGHLVKSFGIIKDQKRNVSWSQKGIVIAAAKYSPVKTVFDGSVAFSGEIEGKGSTVIIDHGDHYYTVYGSNIRINVSVGDEVKQGQILAWSGYSEEEKLDGIYFEIRHFSEPFDPRPWLKGMQL